jgi:hypothetical protein
VTTPVCLCDVGGDAPRFVAGEQFRRRPSSRLLLEIDVGKRPTVGVADDEAPLIQLGVGLIDGPGRREAAMPRMPQGAFVPSPSRTLGRTYRAVAVDR